ncbi:DNA polymerase zeta catalytic subunit-like protein [Tanacetum coccineum]
METYHHLDNGTYDIVERVMHPLALRQTRRPRSDHGKARRSISSSSSHHQGTSSHQHDDDDDDVETSRASTSSPTTYLNSLHPLDYQNYHMPSTSEQTDETLFAQQTTLLNKMQRMHEEMHGGFKSFGKALKGVFRKKKKFLVYKFNVENIINNTIIESAEAEFFESTFPYKDKDKQISNPRKRVLDDELSQDQRANTSEVPQENAKPKRSKHAKANKYFRHDYMTYIVNEEPQTYKAAMESSEAPYWKETIHSEIDSIVHNNTWILVDLPSGHKPISHKWMFKKKLRPDGTIEKYKARLVAEGYRQKEGQYFFDTYSPGTRIISIRTLIAIAIIHNLIIHQMDVKTAFLNGELDKEIYMQQPEGFVVKGQEHKTMLHSSFDMKDMGEADVILGKSTIGYVFTLGGAVVSWKSSKQTVNTRSTMKAEFVALDKAAKEVEWIRSFLEGIPLWPKPVTAVCIHCDSMDALTRANNHIYNGKSTHIRRRHNTIKDLLRNGIISIDCVKSKENIADPLTKCLCREHVIFTSRAEYYGIFLIGITYTKLTCGRIFGNQMAKFSKILNE